MVANISNELKKIIKKTSDTNVEIPILITLKTNAHIQDIDISDVIITGRYEMINAYSLKANVNIICHLEQSDEIERIEYDGEITIA